MHERAASFLLARRVAAVVIASLLGCLVAGCNIVARAAPDHLGQFDFGGLTRTYVVHAPAGASHPVGLVVNLHGRGSTGRGQQALTHYDAVADTNGFVVVYPDGIDRGWADGRGVSDSDRRGIDDVGFISALAGKLAADYGVDPGHVFATGISNGAFMTNRLACDRADLFAAIAPVSGTLGINVGCAPSRPVAVLETHGTADPLVPFGGGPSTGRGGSTTIVSAPAMVDRWREVDGCHGAPAEDVLPGNGDGTEVRRFTSTACDGGAAVVFMQVDNGGHTWPGGTQYLPTAIIGLTSHAFDASEASWQFFASHAR
jgi:polyhydroxybutyrate depolymerase